jgi:hypothetical protein
VSAQEFRDDDPGYLAWIAAHPGGYVINIRRSHNPRDARLHLATCRWISGENPRGGPWTGRYVKVCADGLSELEQWATDHAGGPIRRCGTCHPARDPSPARVERPASPRPRPIHQGSAPVEARREVRGPESNRHVVEAWSDDYVHYQDRPAWQDELRDEIRARVAQLVPADGEALHAIFFGPLPPRTDVENLLLYNFGSLGPATRFGVRFELAGDVPAAPDGSGYAYGYRYALATRHSGYAATPYGATAASSRRSTGLTWGRSGATRSASRCGWRWRGPKPRLRIHRVSRRCRSRRDSRSGRRWAEAGGRPASSRGSSMARSAPSRPTLIHPISPS